MATLRFGDISCDLAPGETVLEGLERCGAHIPNSCRAGACQSCMLQATAGPVPAAAQTGLKETWKRRGYFLACVCRPEQDLEASEIGASADVPATIVEVARLSPTVTRLRLRTEQAFAYEPGQFVTLIRQDGLARSYSLASLPGEGVLELHVRCMPGGRMSTWIHESAAPGERMVVRGPLGECFYTPAPAPAVPAVPDAPSPGGPGDPGQPLLLVGTGTGLAPLWGIAREALRRQHHGPITLIHGARNPAGLYLCDELAALARQHTSFSYLPCVLDAAPSPDRAGNDPGDSEGAGERDGAATLPDRFHVGALDALVRTRLAALPDPRHARAYVCGDPDMVRSLKRLLFLGGMSIQHIFCDAFVTAARPGTTAAGNPPGGNGDAHACV